jgi:hypothetical protein
MNTPGVKVVAAGLALARSLTMHVNEHDPCRGLAMALRSVLRVAPPISLGRGHE